MDSPHAIVELVFASALAAAGCWGVACGLRRLFVRNPELSWVKVPGKVTISGVDEGEDSEGGKTYRVQLEYVYERHGMQFIGERIAPLQFWSNFRSTADSITRRYPPGRAITVYVHPENPGKAVLEPGPQVIAALCYVLLGVAGWIMAFMMWPHG